MPFSALMAWALGEMDEKMLLKEVPVLADSFARAFAVKAPKRALSPPPEDYAGADGTRDGEEEQTAKAPADTSAKAKRIRELQERAKKLGLNNEGDA
jgi:hypothetical protein